MLRSRIAISLMEKSESASELTQTAIADPNWPSKHNRYMPGVRRNLAMKSLPCDSVSSNAGATAVNARKQLAASPGPYIRYATPTDVSNTCASWRESFNGKPGSASVALSSSDVDCGGPDLPGAA